MVDITEISAMVAAAGVLVGVVFTVLQLRDLVKTRQTDLIMRVYSHYGSEGFQKAFDKFRLRKTKHIRDYEEKYGRAEFIVIGTFFEGIGILLRRHLIDIALVDDLFTSPTKLAWSEMKDSIIEVRKEYGMPTIFEWFEYLYNELKKREQKLQQSKA